MFCPHRWTVPSSRPLPTCQGSAICCTCVDSHRAHAQSVRRAPYTLLSSVASTPTHPHTDAPIPRLFPTASHGSRRTLVGQVCCWADSCQWRTTGRAQPRRTPAQTATTATIPWQSTERHAAAHRGTTRVCCVLYVVRRTLQVFPSAESATSTSTNGTFAQRRTSSTAPIGTAITLATDTYASAM